jgi:6-phosphogluconolactonase
MRASFKLLSAVAMGLALQALSLRAEFLYVSNVNGQTISAHKIAENGALKPLAGSPFPAARGPDAVVVDGHFAYVANLESNTVSTFLISENGALKPIGSPVPAGNEPVSPAVDFLSPFLYVANVADGTVSAYSIGPNEALTPVAGSPFPGQGTFASSLAVDPFSRSVYVTNSISNSSSETVSAYSINPTTGALTPVADRHSPGNSCGSGPLGPVRLRGKRRKHLGLPYR